MWGEMRVNRPEDFNFYLGETADMIRETVSSFAQNEIAPRASEIDKNNDFPSDLWEKMGNLGILGVTVEEKWGGSAKSQNPKMHNPPPRTPLNPKPLHLL